MATLITKFYATLRRCGILNERINGHSISVFQVLHFPVLHFCIFVAPVHTAAELEGKDD